MTPIAPVTHTTVGEKVSARELRIERAAMEFEAILLRRMLAGLERTTHVGGAPTLGGAAQYGSMIVEALADALARAGGLGLAQLIGSTVEANPPKTEAQ
jgi:Rod binding domain-containing protein